MIHNIKDSYKAGRDINNKKIIKIVEIYGFVNLDRILIEETE